MTHVFHSEVNNVLPWQANYTFPSQATKIGKQTVQIQPKGGQTYTPGQTIRIEFPSDGYMNMLNSVLLFDLDVYSPTKSSFQTTLVVSSSGTSFVLGATATATGYYTGATYTPGTANAYRGWYISFDQTAATAGTSNGRQATLANQIGIIRSQTVTTGAITSPLFDNLIIPDGTYNVKLWTGARLQRGGGHNVIKRVRWLYGGMPLEDHPDYPMMVRLLMDAGVGDMFKQTSGAILDGTSATYLDELNGAFGTAAHLVPDMRTRLDQNIRSRTVALNLFTGLSTCKKLIPLKWMAAQLVLELTLASPAEALISTSVTDATFILNRVNFLSELLEFDSTYDTAFYMSLKDKQGGDGGQVKGGVPLKINSWHYHSFNLTGKDNVIQIHERARSVKSVWAVIRDQAADLRWDTCRSYFDVSQSYVSSGGGLLDPVTGANASESGVPFLNVSTDTNNSDITSFQFRLGGRYYPAQPVTCDKGAAEAYIELLKTIDGLGDYHFDNGISPREWTTYYDRTGGSKFIMCAELEHSDVYPDTVSGINSEEMSDLTLILKTNGSPVSKRCDVFVHYDSLIIIRDMNVVDLVM